MEDDANIALFGRSFNGETLTRLRHRSRCDSDNETSEIQITNKSNTTLASAGASLPTTSSGLINLMTSDINEFSSKPEYSQSGEGRYATDVEDDSRIANTEDIRSVTSINKVNKTSKTASRYGSVFSLLGFELTRGYYLAGDETHYEERRERVYTFMTTPFEVERFCIFGFLQCVDTFLFFAAFLPIRIVLAVLHMVTYPCSLLLNYSLKSKNSCSHRQCRILQPAQICDVLKGLLFVLSYFMMDVIDMSRLYHMVRGQAVIKLYVFYNMLDLADRLLSGAGQDLLDALYWTATEPGRKRRRFFKICLHFILALLYVVLHTFLILCQAIVLNVAFNSHNKALLTIMISNNFVEIKGSLFKRIDKNNLLQMSCSDVKERFHLTVLLFVVFIRNMTEFNWDFENVGDMVPDTLYIIVAEIGVDWVKHAFITKFNEIPAETYRSFSVSLAQDILTSQEKHAYTDYSDQVCRRMGLAPIPLMCLVMQVCSKSFKLSDNFAYVLVALFCLCLVSSKLLTSILLLSWGCRLLEGAQEHGQETDACDIDSQVLAKKETKKEMTTASPQKSPQACSPQRKIVVNEGSQTPFSGNVALGQFYDAADSWDTDADTVGNGTLHSASDSVILQQSQVYDRHCTPVRKSLSAEVFTTADSWAQEGSDKDSGSDVYCISLDQQVSDFSLESVLGVASGVDYDEEKKFK